MMKTYSVVFTGREQCELLCEELPELQPDQVLVKSDYSLISAGTELANYHALPNTGGGNGDFPMHIGYSTSGHVLQTGSAVKHLQPGDKVAVTWGGHRSHMVCNASTAYRVPDDLQSIKNSIAQIVAKIPDGIDMRDACFVNVATFPMLGVRKLELQMGESVMIAGLGLLGMLAVQYAKLSGACPVMACDYSPERRALEYIAFEGRISLLGCTRVSDQTIDFYKYVHRRGIKLIGAHTCARPNVESRPGEWTQWDDVRTFFRYLQTGRMQVAPLRTRLVSPRDCGAVYHEIGSMKNPPFGNVFDWTDF